MKDQFFYQTNGRVHGPVKFVALVALLRKGSVSPQDLIRRQGTNQWQKAESVMTAVLAKYPEILDRSDTQTPTSEQPSKTATASGYSGQMRPHQVRASPLSVVTAVLSFVGGIIAYVCRGAAHATSSIVRKFEAKHLIVTTAILAWVGANAFYLYQQRPPYEQEVTTYKALGAIWKDFLQLRNDDATSSDWDVFRADAQPKAASIAAELEAGISARDQVRMQLLWAARDYLPQMLVDAQDASSTSESLFVAHMKEAAELLAAAGQPVPEY